MSLRRILAMMRKEVIQIWRDPRSLLVIFAMPIVQLVIYGYGVNLDIKHIPLCVYDRDATQTSQDLLKHFQATDYFTIVHVAENYHDVIQQIDRGACTVAVVVPPQFSEELHSRGQAPVQALLDASDSNTASIGMGYALSIIQAYSQQVQIEWQQRHGLPPVTPNVTFQPRTWFNEDLESMANIVPGVVAMVMAVVGAFLTSLTIAREWERGTMEQLIATPVGKLEIQIGKLIPYFVIGMMDTALCAGAAVWWFGVPFRGSWTVLFACSALFLIVVLSLGYFFSVTAKSQLGASQLALLVTLLPAFLLSGFIFPIDQMPVVVQWITRILPARYYVSILRNVFLKGTAVRLVGGRHHRPGDHCRAADHHGHPRVSKEAGMKFVSSLRRIGHMVKKEFIQTLRDPHMRWLLFGPPIIQMLVFGYAATLDVKNVALAVLDLDNTQESRELVARFSASRYFHLNQYAARRADLRDGLDRGDILAAMEIDSGFAQHLHCRPLAVAQALGEAGIDFHRRQNIATVKAFAEVRGAARHIRSGENNGWRKSAPPTRGSPAYCPNRARTAPRFLHPTWPRNRTPAFE